MSQLELSVRESQSSTVISLSGELDISTAEEVERAVVRALEDKPGQVILDLRELTFIDSTGLRLILASDSQVRSADQRLSVVAGPERVHRVFRIAGILDRLDFVDPPPAS